MGFKGKARWWRRRLQSRRSGGIAGGEVSSWRSACRGPVSLVPRESAPRHASRNQCPRSHVHNGSLAVRVGAPQQQRADDGAGALRNHVGDSLRRGARAEHVDACGWRPRFAAHTGMVQPWRRSRRRAVTHEGLRAAPALEGVRGAVQVQTRVSKPRWPRHPPGRCRSCPREPERGRQRG